MGFCGKPAAVPKGALGWQIFGMPEGMPQLQTRNRGNCCGMPEGKAVAGTAAYRNYFFIFRRMSGQNSLITKVMAS